MCLITDSNARQRLRFVSQADDDETFISKSQQQHINPSHLRLSQVQKSFSRSLEGDQETIESATIVEPQVK